MSVSVDYMMNNGKKFVVKITSWHSKSESRGDNSIRRCVLLTVVLNQLCVRPRYLDY
ncbi:hypothetical protein F443_20719 [Phytophthora nicotianae P1569]|uniref:Uncharacterized protein n=1 Tax=Phytophthora nicotianae P1569 TaxID=1317065 RepID=V9E079_PHYNI|nr:hypothetical protein F443_20719 [Phytophthora nicotianae P1569]